MDTMSLLIMVISLLAGGLIAWFAAKSRSGAALAALQARLEMKDQAALRSQHELENVMRQLLASREENASLKASQTETLRRLQEQQLFVEQAQKNLKDAFGALSADALQHNNTSFVELAKASWKKKLPKPKVNLKRRNRPLVSW
jgi:DNA recombination protein RmuC